MAKNDNSHAIRLYSALSEYAGTEKADQFAELHPLGKSADVTQKARWALEACRFLDETCQQELIPLIRERCICTDGTSAAKLMRACLNKSDSIRDFVNLFNQKDSSGGYLEYVSEQEILMCYPACFCSCVKRSPEAMPLSWCLCSVGYAKRLFSQVFDFAFRAELISSVKTGGERCAVRICWK